MFKINISQHATNMRPMIIFCKKIDFRENLKKIQNSWKLIEFLIFFYFLYKKLN